MKRENVSPTTYLCMQNLKEVRNRKNYSLDYVSAYLAKYGVYRETKTIYGWETGQSEPPLEALLLMARLLDCPDIFELCGIPFDLEGNNPPLLSHTEKSLLAKAHKDSDLEILLEQLLKVLEK